MTHATGDVGAPANDGPSYSERPADAEGARVVDARGPRDALIGGRIFAVLGSLSVASHGVWWIVTATEAGGGESSAFRAISGWVFLGLAVIIAMLGMQAARGGRRARYYAGNVGLALSLLVIGGLPTSIVAVPFIVSAYFLLRSLPAA